MTASDVALCRPHRRDQARLPGLLRRRRLNDGVGILMRREPATNARRLSGAVQLGADPGGRARLATCWAAQNAEQRASRQGSSELEPGLEVRP